MEIGKPVFHRTRNIQMVLPSELFINLFELKILQCGKSAQSHDCKYLDGDKNLSWSQAKSLVDGRCRRGGVAREYEFFV